MRYQTRKKVVFREMFNSPWWPLLAYLIVNVDGKLDGQHVDKHSEHHPVNVSYLEAEQRKAYHGHDNLFGARMCKITDVSFKLYNLYNSLVCCEVLRFC